MKTDFIICDVDGCLSPEESIPWDLEAFMRLAQITRAATAGMGNIAPMTLCTGRPQPYVEVMMKMLDIQAPAICENGAVIYSLHDNYARFTRQVTQEKIEGIRRVLDYIDTVILPELKDTVLQFGKEAQLSVFSTRPEQFPDIKASLLSYIDENALPELVINASHYYLNISLKGVDKGSALRELMEILDTDADHLVGIGDTEGDLPLREVVGFFACPANAQESIKQIADYVSPYSLVEGVIDILNQPACRRE